MTFLRTVVPLLVSSLSIAIFTSSLPVQAQTEDSSMQKTSHEEEVQQSPLSPGLEEAQTGSSRGTSDGSQQSASQIASPSEPSVGSATAQNCCSDTSTPLNVDGCLDNSLLGKVRISYDNPPAEMPALRLTPDATSRIVALTNQVLLKEIELLKLNTNFRMSTTERGRVKPWRVFLYNMAGSAVATAGITTVAAERWRTWQRPATASRNTLKAGPTMLLISHSIMTGGVLFEAMLDLINDRKQHKMGLDAKTTKKRAIELRDAIDQKLTERASVLNDLSEEDREIATAEGLVLQDIRNMALAEYAQFHVRSAKRKAARNFSYINGFSAATTGGYLGSLLGLLAVADRKPNLAGPAGIGFTISGANIASGPLLGRATAYLAGKTTKSRINRELGTFAPAQLQDHFTLLKQRSLRDDPSLNARLVIYEEVDALLKRQAQMNVAEKKKADREFMERCFYNAIIGGTKMGWGIQLANAGFGFHPAARAKAPTLPVKVGGKTVNVPVGKALKTPAQLFAHRVAQGSTTYIPGTSLWMIDTVQARTRGEMDVYTMGSQDALPHQKLNARMSKLDAMENKLKGGSL